MASFFSSSVLKPSVANSMFFDVTHDNDPGHILVRMCVWILLLSLLSLPLSSFSLDQFLMLFLIQLSSQSLPAPAAVAVVTMSSSPTRFVPFLRRHGYSLRPPID